jgi:hypothetical protein
MQEKEHNTFSWFYCDGQQKFMVADIFGCIDRWDCLPKVNMVGHADHF